MTPRIATNTYLSRAALHPREPTSMRGSTRHSHLVHRFSRPQNQYPHLLRQGDRNRHLNPSPGHQWFHSCQQSAQITRYPHPRPHHCHRPCHPAHPGLRILNFLPPLPLSTSPTYLPFRHVHLSHDGVQPDRYSLPFRSCGA
jgi:hypothetical protein